MEYSEFLHRKTQLGGNYGFKPLWMPDFLFDFQSHLTEWAIQKGRAALLEDCGLGKTPQYLVWSQNIVQHTNKNVIIVTPATVAYQTVKEGEKFGIECKQSRDGKIKSKITVTNYEQLHKFDPLDFIGFVGDESGILKNFEGVTKNIILDFTRKLPFRLLCTATAAPNDYPEVGNHSEVLGELGYMDMLRRFFKNEQNTCDLKRKWKKHGGPPPKFRFLNHAEPVFWRWMASWSRAIRKPSDLGFEDNGFILPKLIETQWEVGDHIPLPGQLFPDDIIGMGEQRKELRRTLQERCEMAAERAINHQGSSVLWCHLNDEGDLLEKLVPGSVQVHGRQSDEEKEEKLIGFVNGQYKKLITKESIAGYGHNWQHCDHMTYFPWHSFEQYYQSIRRAWRFGQKNEVNIDVVTTPGLAYVLANLQRKAVAAEKMFAQLIANMNDALTIDRLSKFKQDGRVPSWMC